MRMERGGVSWDRSKCGEQASKWVARERNVVQNEKVGWSPSEQKAQVTLLGNKKTNLGP